MVFKDWLEDIRCQVLQGSLETEVSEVVYDSRRACEGAVFVAMAGSRVDSHEFCSQVYTAGVRVFVTERPVSLPEDATVVLVENGREALAHLSAARFGFPARKMITIGVTGTKGKTTTTHMIKAALTSCGKKVGMIGTNGVSFPGTFETTRNTTPESYQLHWYFSRMLEAGCEYMVMEVSSQAVKMHRTDGILFDYGIFTNITPDHIGPDEHENFEEYFRCKSAIFKQSRTGIANLDDKFVAKAAENALCPVYGYSLTGGADFCAEDIGYLAEKDFVGLEFSMKGRLSGNIRVGIPGRFNVENAVAALSVCSLAGLPQDKLCTALEKIHMDGRMEIAYASEDIRVIIDYAHNAVSMESLLTTLRDYHPARLVVVFGCGGNRAKERRYAMGEMAGKLADLSILTADNSRYERVEDILEDIKSALIPTGGKYLEIPDRKEAIVYAVTHAQKGDMIAVIGKGHEDYQEVNGVRTHFLDREVVDEAVKQARTGVAAGNGKGK